MGLFNRHLRLLFLVTALVVAAFSTGIDFLFFLVYLTVAIGCTGGQHRSVYIVQALARRFGPTERVLVRHRSLAARPPAAIATQTP